MDPVSAVMQAVTAVANVISQLTQERILIAQNLPAEQRQQWAVDQQKLAQPWIDLLLKLTPKIT